MKLKKNSGFVAVDMVVAIIAIMIFSILIFSVMKSNMIENAKLKKETWAMIYITEIFENIGIETYDNITLEYVNNIVPENARENYEVEIDIDTDLNGITINENIIKKITIKMSYEIDKKRYSCSMERMKIKE